MALVSGSEQVLGADVRALADVLAALFEHDRELAGAMNAAQRRLVGASDDMRGLAGCDPAGPLRRDLADAIRAAFGEYRHAVEDHRRLGADVGEAAARLVDALGALGYSEAQARGADVWALREGVYRPAWRAER